MSALGVSRPRTPEASRRDHTAGCVELTVATRSAPLRTSSMGAPAPHWPWQGSFVGFDDLALLDDLLVLLAPLGALLEQLVGVDRDHVVVPEGMHALEYRRQPEAGH